MANSTPLEELTRLGQSVWLDYIRRGILDNGELERMIRERSLRGVTSNPAIFEQAIARSDDYDDELALLAAEGADALEVYETLAVADIQRAADRPHRYTIISPHSEGVARDEICANLASTLASLYRAEIDATGQPTSPEPFGAVRNAIAHYRVDDILISTFAGEKSAWLEEDLIGRVREITDKPVEHMEVGRPAEKIAAAVAEGFEQVSSDRGIRED